jgi:hypothetical protein
MTTTVHIGVHCPNVHRARIVVQDKRDGEWVDTETKFVDLGTDKVFSGDLTDTRRVVVEEFVESAPQP